MVDIKTVMNSPGGAIAVSIVLGLGLAAVFRLTCKDGKCIVIQGPPPGEIDGHYYKLEDRCYKYSRVAAHCPM
jgi:hypothetical protein